MFYYENLNNEKFEIAFNCRGGVESLYLKGSETMMSSRELAEAVFGPEGAKPGKYETWEDMGDMAMDRVFDAYADQKKKYIAAFREFYFAVPIVMEPTLFEDDLIIVYRYADTGNLAVAFLDDEGVWQDSPMSKHIIETFKLS